MPRELIVHRLPEHFEPEALRGAVAVVIDVLRASTTIVHALAAGAECVIPFGDVQEALDFAAGRPKGTVVLGGERGGKRIEGFDLDNSPFSYTPDVVQGKTVAFTTTNGTKALLRSRLADRIIIGSFVNFLEVVRELEKDARPVHFVCAGTDGEETAEDTLCAESLSEQVRKRHEWSEWLASRAPGRLSPDDRKRLRSPGRSFQQLRERILPTLRDSLGGRNLIELGYDADIEQAAKLGLFDLVPIYQPLIGRIVSSSAIW